MTRCCKATEMFHHSESVVALLLRVTATLHSTTAAAWCTSLVVKAFEGFNVYHNGDDSEDDDSDNNSERSADEPDHPFEYDEEDHLKLSLIVAQVALGEEKDQASTQPRLKSDGDTPFKNEVDKSKRLESFPFKDGVRPGDMEQNFESSLWAATAMIFRKLHLDIASRTQAVFWKFDMRKSAHLTPSLWSIDVGRRTV
ncbi:hypothetical protein DFJ77DRAFT_541323 [Powellomyces hirtus]|nr:hypothetical protein DFJ77DRAFT_541323 [Powellomyces hirtus]